MCVKQRNSAESDIKQNIFSCSCMVHTEISCRPSWLYRHEKYNFCKTDPRVWRFTRHYYTMRQDFIILESYCSDNPFFVHLDNHMVKSNVDLHVFDGQRSATLNHTAFYCGKSWTRFNVLVNNTEVFFFAVLGCISFLGSLLICWNIAFVQTVNSLKQFLSTVGHFGKYVFYVESDENIATSFISFCPLQTWVQDVFGCA